MVARPGKIRHYSLDAGRRGVSISAGCLTALEPTHFPGRETLKVSQSVKVLRSHPRLSGAARLGSDMTARPSSDTVNWKEGRQRGIFR